MTAPEQTTMGVGEIDRSRSQFFTPADLALRVWRWASNEHSGAALNVLEPCAGRGALLAPVMDSARKLGRVVAYELDPVNADALRHKFGSLVDVRPSDFLTMRESRERFDLALLNPPYEDGQDVAFAAACCSVATRAVGIFPGRMLHSKGRAEFWRWHDIARMGVLCSRPRFGGPMQGKTDFLVLDLVARKAARLQGYATTTSLEFWE